ncbi:uncharacterized protein LOC134825858 [Bolinopsis microptera]|uniref:uncharacterized protein LOC134818787 n=1 Tax=Bolinopsis microptera TaxID=2820187 RepID=UPI00307AB289
MAWKGDDTLRLYLDTKVQRNWDIRNEILPSLPKEFPHYKFSESNLRRMLKHFGIRKTREADKANLRGYIELILARSTGSLGYRAVAAILRNKYDIRVSEKAVEDELLEIEPENVARRDPANKLKHVQKGDFSVKGPNYLYSLDGHDKLAGLFGATFDIHIYGAMDTFSRKVMVMKVAHTNKNPKIVGKMYFDFVMKNRFIPRRIRVDRGTETGEIAAIQLFLLQKNGFPQTPIEGVIYGPSTANRIERLWRTLKEHLEPMYKEQLRELASSGYYQPADPVDRNLLSAIYIPHVQRSLDEFVQYWNSHKIRAQSIEMPCGRPDVLFDNPAEPYQDCRIVVTTADLLELSDQSDMNNVQTELQLLPEVAAALNNVNLLDEAPQRAERQYVRARSIITTATTT